MSNGQSLSAIDAAPLQGVRCRTKRPCLLASATTAPRLGLQLPILVLPMIVEGLHKIQEEHGYLPQEELLALARRLQTPLHRLQEVASFFPHFHLQEQPPVEVLVCHDMACHLRGAAAIKSDLEKSTREGKLAGKAQVHFASCLGRCDRAPAATVNEEVYCGKTAAELTQIAAAHLDGRPPQAAPEISFPRTASRPTTCAALPSSVRTRKRPC